MVVVLTLGGAVPGLPGDDVNVFCPFRGWLSGFQGLRNYH